MNIFFTIDIWISVNFLHWAYRYILYQCEPLFLRCNPKFLKQLTLDHDIFKTFILKYNSPLFAFFENFCTLYYYRNQHCAVQLLLFPLEAPRSIFSFSSETPRSFSNYYFPPRKNLFESSFLMCHAPDNYSFIFLPCKNAAWPFSYAIFLLVSHFPFATICIFSLFPFFPPLLFQILIQLYHHFTPQNRPGFQNIFPNNIVTIFS